MELRHLRYFLSVADHLHFGRASEHLGIAPPTLSVQIQQIERTLKAQLFTRTKRSVELTDAGHAFAEEARAVLARYEQALHVGRRAGRGELGRVEIGYVGSAIFGGILQQQISAFRQAWPDAEVQAREWPMDKLADAVEEGSVDVAFVRMPVALPSSLQAHVLLRDRFCVALPADHVLAQRKSISPAALKGEAFILPEQELGTREVCRRGDFTPRREMRPGTLLAVLAEVSVGAGIAVIPSILTRAVELPHVVYRPLAGAAIPSEVAAVFRKFEQAPAVRHMIDAVRKTPAVVVSAVGK